jgi:hypothetical protein
MAQMSEEITEEGGGKMLLILGLVAGLAIGGAGVFFLLPSGGEDEAQVTEVADKAPENLVSVTFEQIAVPIYREHRGQSRFIGNFFVKFDLNVDGEANAVTVRRAQSRLQHAFLARIGEGSLMREDSPTELDYTRAATVLEAAAKEVVGPDIIYSVSVSEAIRTRN